MNLASLPCPRCGETGFLEYMQNVTMRMPVSIEEKDGYADLQGLYKESSIVCIQDGCTLICGRPECSWEADVSPWKIFQGPLKGRSLQQIFHDYFMERDA